MMSGLPIDPILRRFRAALADLYGARLHRVVLYGSHARGEAQSDSDVNVAVFLDPLPDRWAELDRLADLRVRFLDDDGVFFEARPFQKLVYDDLSPLMHEVRRDGIEF